MDRDGTRGRSRGAGAPCRKESEGQDLEVGDHVAFTIGRSEFTARVVEDRGHIGVGGRQIVRIELETSEPEDRRTFEMASADLERQCAS